MPQFFQMQDIGAIVPELELIVFGMFLLIFDLLIEDKRKLGLLALAGIGISGLFLFRLREVDFSAYGGTLVLDPFAIFFKLIFLVAAALSIAISLRYLDIERVHGNSFRLSALPRFAGLAAGAHGSRSLSACGNSGSS